MKDQVDIKRVTLWFCTNCDRTEICVSGDIDHQGNYIPQQVRSCLDYHNTGRRELVMPEWNRSDKYIFVQGQIGIPNSEICRWRKNKICKAQAGKKCAALYGNNECFSLYEPKKELPNV